MDGLFISNFTDDIFNEMFNAIDDDGSEILGKDEMVILIK
jgi:hypothetical protein